MAASDAAAMPFPNEETTPPVTNTNLVIGWPVPEIAILPERGASLQAYRAQRSRARRAHAAPVQRSGQPAVATVAVPRHPLTRRIAADELEHGVDRRRLGRPRNERAQRHHHLRGLQAVTRGGGLDRGAERLARPVGSVANSPAARQARRGWRSVICSASMRGSTRRRLDRNSAPPRPSRRASARGRAAAPRRSQPAVRPRRRSGPRDSRNGAVGAPSSAASSRFRCS